MESVPEKAEVLVDGRFRGRTPFTMEVRFPGTRTLEVAAPGRDRVRLATDLRPSPPAWLFPLDFLWELPVALFTDRDRAYTFELTEAARETPKGPAPEEIRRMARRADEMGLLEVGRRP